MSGEGALGAEGGSKGGAVARRVEWLDKKAAW